MSNLPKLTLLGASSPFTIEFINKIASAKTIDTYNLVLFGRNTKRLELVFAYALYHLNKKGWLVEIASNLEHALSEASIVIHQNRYGGWEGRHEDEMFAKEFRFPADETLGPCGLKSSIRMAPHLKTLAKKILTFCPDALVINLTNPLSIAVSILHKEGVSNALGVCELPNVTFEEIARTLELPANQIQWDYLGLNHRGFIYNIKFEEQDLFPIFLNKIRAGGFNGFTYLDIKNLGAIPLKYFRLFIKPYQSEERAQEVKAVGDRIIQELFSTVTRSPGSLNERSMNWYEKAVIPLLCAATSSDQELVLINKADQTGITLESKAHISRGIITTLDAADASSQVSRWVTSFLSHEKATLEAALDPSPQNIIDALLLDPLVSSELDVNAIQQYILSYYYKEQEHANS